ncbi:TetR family transcriptional regulator [Shewanella olleyana]|uniref:TetR family transcriptional regulator n=1 Tax=Shewanella olleyana TaxID=135626 RepID=UPI00200CB6BD|nr:TetR family transcriptional regulator [Shewanella olleyana]MCL1067971.1 TetR family transcriptional regulator [Shewanella olleyana]
MPRLKKTAGRPLTQVDNRSALIDAARVLFVENDYEKVSVRAIAQQANVDASLIRYYFQSKIGLFSEMLKETLAPITEKIYQTNKEFISNSAEDILSTYYTLMSQNPDFPKLIYRTASLPDSQSNRELQARLLALMPAPRFAIIEQMQDANLLKADVDIMCAKMSFISLLIFPFLMPDLLKNAVGIKTSPEFMQKLAKHNAQLLHHGLIADDTLPSQDR